LAIVHVSLATPLADGTTTPAAGVLRFTPTARRTIVGTPDKVVLPASFQVSLTAGAVDVTLATTTADWVWRVDEHLPGVTGRTIYFAVPNVAEVDYSELVPIDPDTLAPSPTPQPAWISSLNLSLAADPETIMVGTITRDANQAPTNAGVVWPDGTAGTYTGTASGSFPGAIDSYTITYGTRTYTQPTVTRNANGGITTKPAITIS
jgi:hypothetical protein